MIGHERRDEIIRVVVPLLAPKRQRDAGRSACLLQKLGPQFLFDERVGSADIDEDSIEDLVEEDMDNVLGLFREFNNGTHGHAGRFTITQLSALRIRVESAIGFIHALCAI